MAMDKWGRVSIGLLACFVCGCAHGPRHVTDEDPSDKIPAIKHAVQSKDRSALPQLVKDLNSDDPAVRFYAIDALRKLCGQDFGYRYYEDDEQRKAAVVRWNNWLVANGSAQPRRQIYAGTAP